MDFRGLRRALTRKPFDMQALRSVLEGAGLRMLRDNAHGNLAAWLAVLDSLPSLDKPQPELASDVVRTGGLVSDLPQLEARLIELSPWRKGPFAVADIVVDAEWRSNIKWARVCEVAESMQGRHVLDVGCGNGYYGLRALGAGACSVLGVDPSPLFVAQFEAMKHFLGDVPAWVLPLRSDQLPADLACFDTVLSMGVLYHRPSPFEHLRELKQALRPGGQLVLETLVTKGGASHVMVPEGCYAGMRNVYFLPSPLALEGWLRRVGFSNPRTVDMSTTTPREQRSTRWASGQSLADFLNPADASRTREGLPAPLRAIVLAEKS